MYSDNDYPGCPTQYALADIGDDMSPMGQNIPAGGHNMAHNMPSMDQYYPPMANSMSNPRQSSGSSMHDYESTIPASVPSRLGANRFRGSLTDNEPFQAQPYMSSLSTEMPSRSRMRESSASHSRIHDSNSPQPLMRDRNLSQSRMHDSNAPYPLMRDVIESESRMRDSHTRQPNVRGGNVSPVPRTEVGGMHERGSFHLDDEHFDDGAYNPASPTHADYRHDYDSRPYTNADNDSPHDYDNLPYTDRGNYEYNATNTDRHSKRKRAVDYTEDEAKRTRATQPYSEAVDHDFQTTDLKGKFDKVRKDEPMFTAPIKSKLKLESLQRDAKVYQKQPTMLPHNTRMVVGECVSTFPAWIANYKTQPLIGLKYITEYVAPYKPSSRFLCALCVTQMIKSSVVTHVTGKRHRLNYLKVVDPTLHKEISAMTVKLDQTNEVFKAAAELERKMGRETIIVVYPAVEDVDKKKLTSVSSNLIARKKDLCLIGLKYVTEFVTRRPPFNRFKCDLCEQDNIGHAQILNHLVSQLHRELFMKKEKPALFKQITSIVGNPRQMKALFQASTDIVQKEGQQEITVVYEGESHAGKTLKGREGRRSSSAGGDSNSRGTGQKRPLFRDHRDGSTSKLQRTGDREPTLRHEDRTDQGSSRREPDRREPDRRRGDNALKGDGERRRGDDARGDHDRNREEDNRTKRDDSRNVGDRRKVEGDRRKANDDQKKADEKRKTDEDRRKADEKRKIDEHRRKADEEKRKTDEDRRKADEKRKTDEHRRKADENKTKDNRNKNRVDNVMGKVNDNVSKTDDGKNDETDNNGKSVEKRASDEGSQNEEETEREDIAVKEVESKKAATTCKLRTVIKDSEAAMLGLSFITEFQNSSDPDHPKYTCSLCECNCGINFIVPHITGLQHRTKFMEKYYPEEYAEVADIKGRNEKRVQTEIQAKLIEVDMGREEVIVKVIDSAPSAAADKPLMGKPSRSPPSTEMVPPSASVERVTKKLKTDKEVPKKNPKFVIPKIQPDPIPSDADELTDEPAKISLKPGARLDMDDLDILKKFEELIFCEPPILKYDNPFRAKARFLCGQCGYRDKSYNLVMTHRRQTSHSHAEIFDSKDLIQLGSLSPEFEMFTCAMCGFNGTSLDSMQQHISVNVNHKKNVPILVGGIYFSPNYVEAIAGLYMEKIEKDEKAAAIQSSKHKGSMSDHSKTHTRQDGRQDSVLERSEGHRHHNRQSRLDSRDSKMENRKSISKGESSEIACAQTETPKSDERASRPETKPRSESRGSKIEAPKSNYRQSRPEARGEKTEPQKSHHKQSKAESKGAKTETPKSQGSRSWTETGGARVETSQHSPAKTETKAVDKTRNTEMKQAHTVTPKSVSKTVNYRSNSTSKVDHSKSDGKSMNAGTTRPKAETFKSPSKTGVRATPGANTVTEKATSSPAKSDTKGSKTATTKSIGKSMTDKNEGVKSKTAMPISKTVNSGASNAATEGAKTDTSKSDHQSTKSEAKGTEIEICKSDSKVINSFVKVQRLKSKEAAVKVQPVKTDVEVDKSSKTEQPIVKEKAEYSSNSNMKQTFIEKETVKSSKTNTEQAVTRGKVETGKSYKANPGQITIEIEIGKSTTTNSKQPIIEETVGTASKSNMDQPIVEVETGKSSKTCSGQPIIDLTDDVIDLTDDITVTSEVTADKENDKIVTSLYKKKNKYFICAFCGFNSISATTVESHKIDEGHPNAVTLDSLSVGSKMEQEQVRSGSQQKYSCSVCAFSSNFQHLVKCHTDKLDIHSRKGTILESTATGTKQGKTMGDNVEDKGQRMDDTDEDDTQRHGYWKCTSCGHICPNTAIDRWRHFALRHSAEAPFTCSVCWLRSTDEGDVISHQKATGETDGNIIVQGRISPILFGLQPDFIEVGEENVGEVFYMTCSCGYKTDVESLMKAHTAAADDKHRVTKCKMATLGDNLDNVVVDLSLEKHIPAHALTEVKQYRPLICKCRICDVSKTIDLNVCVDSAPLQFWPIRHYLLCHSTDPPYFCALCGFKAVSRERVKEHIVERKHGSDYEILQGEVINYPSFDTDKPDITLKFGSDLHQNLSLIGAPVSTATDSDDDAAPNLSGEDKDLSAGWTYETVASIIELMKTRELLHGHLWKCTSCGVCVTTERLANIHYQLYHSELPPYRCGDCDFPGWNLRYMENHFLVTGHSCETLKENSELCYPYFFGEQRDFVPVRLALADEVGRGKQDKLCIPGEGYKAYRPMAWECRICNVRKPWPARISPEEITSMLEYPFTHHDTHTCGLTVCTDCGIRGIHRDQMEKHADREKHRLASAEPVLDGPKADTVLKICDLDDGVVTATSDSDKSMDKDAIKTKLYKLLNKQTYRVTLGKPLYFVKATPPLDNAWKCTVCGFVLTTSETASHFLGYHTRCPDDVSCTVCRVESKKPTGIDTKTEDFLKHIKQMAAITLPYFFGPQADFVPVATDSVATATQNIPCKPLQIVKSYERMLWNCKLCGVFETTADQPGMTQSDLSGSLKSWPIEHFVLHHSLNAPFMCPCGERTMDKAAMESHCRAFKHDVLKVKVGKPTIPNLIGKNPDLILTLAKPNRTTDIQAASYSLEKELAIKTAQTAAKSTPKTTATLKATTTAKITTVAKTTTASNNSMNATTTTEAKATTSAKMREDESNKEKLEKMIARRRMIVSNRPEDKIVPGKPLLFGSPKIEILHLFFWECTHCGLVSEYYNAVNHFRYYHSSSPIFSCDKCGFRGVTKQNKRNDVVKHVESQCTMPGASLINRKKESNKCQLYGPQADVIPLDPAEAKLNSQKIDCQPGSIIKRNKLMAWKCNVCDTSLPIDPKVFELEPTHAMANQHMLANKHYLLNHSPDVPFQCDCGIKLHDAREVITHKLDCKYYKMTTGKRITMPDLYGDRPDLILVMADEVAEVKEKTSTSIKVTMVTGIGTFVRDDTIPFLEHFPSPCTSLFWMCTVCGVNVATPRAADHFMQYHMVHPTEEKVAATKVSSSNLNQYPFFFGPQADFVPRGRYAVLDRQRRTCTPGELIKRYLSMEWFCKRCEVTKSVWTDDQVPTKRSILELSRWPREHYVMKHSKVTPYTCGQCHRHFYREADAIEHCTLKKHQQSAIIRGRADSIEYPAFEGKHPDMVLRLQKDKTAKTSSKSDSKRTTSRRADDIATTIVVDIVGECDPTPDTEKPELPSNTAILVDNNDKAEIDGAEGVEEMT